MTAPERQAVAQSALDLIGRTPLVRLNRVVAPGGATVLGKLESRNPGGSVKDRIALAMIDEAERNGTIGPGASVVEPTSGNTGIALALVAKLRGYKLTCVMPANATPERRLVLELFGATIVDSDGREYLDFVGSWGPLILGHAHPKIVAAVVEQRDEAFVALADQMALR